MINPEKYALYVLERNKMNKVITFTNLNLIVENDYPKSSDFTSEELLYFEEIYKNDMRKIFNGF